MTDMLTAPSWESAVLESVPRGFGLASYLMTSHIDRARRVAARLQAGMVGINRGLVSEVAAPFGGVKQSGLGREGGPEGLHEYQQLKYLSLPGFHS